MPIQGWNEKNLKKQKCLYILTTPESMERDRYKIGSHTGTIKQLRKRYITYLPDLIICDFYVHPKSMEIERVLKKIFISVREKNENQRLCEYVIIKLDVLQKVIQILIQLYEVVLPQSEPFEKSEQVCISPYFISTVRKQETFLVNKKENQETKKF